MLVLKVILYDDTTEEFICDTLNFDGDCLNIYRNEKLIREIELYRITMVYLLPFDSGLV